MSICLGQGINNLALASFASTCVGCITACCTGGIGYYGFIIMSKLFAASLTADRAGLGSDTGSISPVAIMLCRRLGVSTDCTSIVLVVVSGGVNCLVAYSCMTIITSNGNRAILATGRIYGCGGCVSMFACGCIANCFSNVNVEYTRASIISG